MSASTSAEKVSYTNHQDGSANTSKPPVVLPGTGNNIVVNPCQRGNPILECVRNVGKEFGDIVADYQVGRTTGVLFLSLRYHRLHPEYIHQRIERLGLSYNLRILLLMCDVSEHQEPIRELTRICLINNITVMVAWTAEEAGFYLTTYKQFEHKPPDLIKERVDKDYNSMLRTALTSISKVNKTDVETLRTSFGSFADIARATSDQLQNLPGFGQVKAKRIVDAFERPFRNNATSTLTSQARLDRSTYLDNGKDKARERSTPMTSTSPLPQALVKPRAPREPSPMWDIELDLNESPPPTAETGSLTNASPQISSQLLQTSTDAAAEDMDRGAGRKRPPSPVWDIELDIDEFDEPEISLTKKRRTDETPSDPPFLLGP